MKPTPFKILSCPLANPDHGGHWVYWMEIDQSERECAEHERRALLMMHAPGLLHELKIALELLVDVCDHHRQEKPLPSALACRRAALDAWNVIGLAEGKITEGTRHYPPPNDR
jgi:hypothetical protein